MQKPAQSNKAGCSFFFLLVFLRGSADRLCWMKSERGESYFEMCCSINKYNGLYCEGSGHTCAVLIETQRQSEKRQRNPHKKKKDDWRQPHPSLKSNPLSSFSGWLKPTGCGTHFSLPLSNWCQSLNPLPPPLGPGVLQPHLIPSVLLAEAKYFVLSQILFIRRRMQTRCGAFLPDKQLAGYFFWLSRVSMRNMKL